MAQENDRQTTLAKIVEQKKAKGMSIVFDFVNKEVPVIKQKKNWLGRSKDYVTDYRYWNWYYIIENGIEWIKVGARFNDGTPVENEWFKYGKKQMPNVKYDEVVQSIYSDVEELYFEQEKEKAKQREAEEEKKRQEKAAEIADAKSRVYMSLAKGLQSEK